LEVLLELKRVSAINGSQSSVFTAYLTLFNCIFV